MLTTELSASLFDFFSELLTPIHQESTTPSVYLKSAYRHAIDSSDLSLHDHVFQYGFSQMPIEDGQLSFNILSRDFSTYYHTSTFWTLYSENSPEYQLIYAHPWYFGHIELGGNMSQTQEKEFSSLKSYAKMSIESHFGLVSGTIEEKTTYPSLIIQTLDEQFIFNQPLSEEKASFHARTTWGPSCLMYEYCSFRYTSPLTNQSNTLSLNSPGERMDIHFLQILIR